MNNILMREAFVFKKTFFLILIGVLLLAACTPKAAETPTDEVAVEPTEIAVETEMSMDGDFMPCTTVYGYEITDEIALYQSVVDQQPPVTEDDWIYGDPNAPITVVEYEDFQCPA